MLEHHGSTRSSQHVKRVESRRDVTSQVEFGLNSANGCIVCLAGSTYKSRKQEIVTVASDIDVGSVSQLLEPRKQTDKMSSTASDIPARHTTPHITMGWLKMPDIKLQDMKMQDMNLQYMTNIVWKYITLQYSVHLF